MDKIDKINIDEQWGFIERFFNYWREELIINGFKKDETYNSFMPTDTDVYTMLKLMKRNNK